MSSNSQDQEIDLGRVISKIGNFFTSILDRFFDFFLFVKRNIIVLSILFIIGAGLGFYLDKNDKNYNHTIIVTPNFGSIDYLYNTIQLINSKKKENDTLFFKEIGVSNVKDFNSINIEPIIDVFTFITNKPENFELIKLMAEDGDLEKIIKNDVTSKNYPFHLIKVNTNTIVAYKSTIEPILNYLNNSDYFNKLKEQNLENLRNRILANDVTINQINTILAEFSNTTTSNQKSDKLIYYNENNQLNEIIKNKKELIYEKGQIQLNLISSDKIIKDIGVTLNIKNNKGLHNKMKLILPILFIFIFLLFSLLKDYYKKQLLKRNLA